MGGKGRRKTKPILIFAGLAITVLMLALHLSPSAFVDYLEHKTYDSLLKATHSNHTSGRTAIVDIDEASLKEYGQWPWPRYRLALLLDKIKQMGASSIALDVVLAEPDRTSPGYLRQEILRDRKLDIMPTLGSEERLDNDLVLAETLRQGPHVISYQFQFGAGNGTSVNCRLHPLEVGYLNAGEAAGTPPLLNANGALCSIEGISSAAPASGFINVLPDSDGIFRRVPLLIRYRGAVYPSLALASVMQASGNRQALLEVSGGRVQALRLEHTIIPLDGEGYLWVHYRGARNTFDYYSAADILENRIPEGRLKEKIIILGTSAIGLKETRPTPLDPLVPGMEIHATIVDNLILGDPISRPQSMRTLEFFLILTLGISSTVFNSRSRAWLAIPFLAVGISALISGSMWMLIRYGTFVSPILPLITIGGSFSLLSALNYWYAEREVRHRTEKLVLTQDVIIQSMAALAETRDSETGGHIQRTKYYIKALAEHLKYHPRFKEALDDNTIDLLFRLAPLHDVGKVGIRDSILLKPGKLTPEEFEEMKKHTTLGARTILQAEQRLGDDSFLHIANEIALTHQEKWDGSGYPRGLKGDEIPLPGRLMAVADVYDALISWRSYKKACSHESALAIMVQGRASHFDPDILDAFLEIQDQIRAIAGRFDAEGREAAAVNGKSPVSPKESGIQNGYYEQKT